MTKITLIGRFFAFLALGSFAEAFAEDVTFHKEFANGQTFELKYSQTGTFVTNLNSNDTPVTVGERHALILGSNSLNQINKLGPFTDYHYTAIAYLSASNSTPIPVWTNQGAWSSPTVGLRTGFEFFDASSDDGNIVVCYKEQFDLYAEKIVLKKPDSTGISNSRQKICSDSFNQEITNAVFIVSNGLPAQIVVTGWLPTKEISWRYEKGNWVQETSK